jgi:hypothetical protein
MVNKSPTHYTRGAIEIWDFIRDQDLNYHRGNAIKYICRAGFKSPATEVEDIKKAIHYLENELDHVMSQQPFGTSNSVSYELLRDELSREQEYAAEFDR